MSNLAGLVCVFLVFGVLCTVIWFVDHRSTSKDSPTSDEPIHAVLTDKALSILLFRASSIAIGFPDDAKDWPRRMVVAIDTDGGSVTSIHYVGDADGIDLSNRRCGTFKVFLGDDVGWKPLDQLTDDEECSRILDTMVQ